MNRIFRFLCLAVLAAVPCSEMAGATATYNYAFAQSSPLASGKWMKIYVDKTGIYELSYDQLREMGFSDPRKVSVFGQGGLMSSHNFTDARGTRLFEDTPSQLPVIYRDDRLYFYGSGPESLSFNGKKFVRNSLNIYSRDGVYLLTDSAVPLEMPEVSPGSGDGAVLRTDLYDYVYHEEDHLHGLSNTGQLYWDYDLNVFPKRTWNLELPYARKDAYNFLDIVFLADTGGVGSVRYGVGKNTRTVGLKRQAPNAYLASNPDCMVNPDGSAEVVIEGLDLAGELAGIDYWVFSYRKNLAESFDDAFVQERLALPAVAASSVPDCVTVPEGAVVIDVTDPKAPFIVETQGSRSYFENNGKIRELMVFNPGHEQFVTDGRYSAIGNQDLHSVGTEGGDLLIICSNMMRPWGERIADLHRKNDDMRVVVVTASELYNEFTGGLPDPMAYRSMVKMMYQSPHPLTNVLFIGPLYGDMRNVTLRPDRAPGLIGYQEAGVILTREAANAMDYFGMAADYINNIYDISQMPVNVGVGVLPVYSSEEGWTAYNKIKEYMESQNFDWLVNETMSISCPGDSHAHDSQAMGCNDYVNNMVRQTSGSKFVHDTQVLDFLGYDKGKADFISAMRDGKLVSFYFGHASSLGVADSYRYLNSSNFQTLDNSNLGFVFFAGCDLSRTDGSVQGIGELCVTRSPRAFVGSIMATRTVWSNYNYDLAMTFVRGLFYNKDGIRDESATIGEAFAYGKSQTSKANDLNYLLIGDPALRVPVALRGIKLEVENQAPVAGGEVLTVKGRVLDRSGATDTDFTGHVSLKLMAPRDSVIFYHNIDTASKDTLSTVHINFDTRRLSSVRATVENGEFTARINVPEEFSRYIMPNAKDAVAPLHVGAYDRERWLGASGYMELPVLPYGDEPSADRVKDTEGPDAECEYDAATQTLRFTVADDVAVMPGIGAGCGLSVTLDGKEIVLDQSKDFDCPVTRYEAVVPVFELAAGMHDVEFTSLDEAGNPGPRRIRSFTKVDPAPFSLSVLAGIATDEMKFALNGPTAGDLTLVVIDSNGKAVYSEPVSGNAAAWDASEATPGVYRAVVREDSAKGSAVYSNWVEFAVID